MQQFLFLPLVLAISSLSLPALAGQPEAREAARLNNCAPKKIEIYQQSMGTTGQTIYRVQCTAPKTVGEASGDKPPDALLIGCDDSLCTLLRPVNADAK